MAIYERARDFQKIFNEIEIGIIPLKFVQDITCFLSDGTKVVLDEQDFNSNGVEINHIEHLLKSLDFYDILTDLQIRINYDRVESDVDDEVAKILSHKHK